MTDELETAYQSVVALAVIQPPNEVRPLTRWFTDHIMHVLTLLSNITVVRAVISFYHWDGHTDAYLWSGSCSFFFKWFCYSILPIHGAIGGG